MVAPVAAVVAGTGKALNFKNVLILTVLTIVVVVILQKISKQTVVLTDNNGNVAGSGEIKTSFVSPLKKA